MICPACWKCALQSDQFTLCARKEDKRPVTSEKKKGSDEINDCLSLDHPSFPLDEHEWVEKK